MAQHHRTSIPDPVAGGEFEVVELGPPKYFSPPPPAAMRGELIASGEGEGMTIRSAPLIEKRRRKSLREAMPVRTFTARFRTPELSEVTVQGHELHYRRSKDSAVVEVLFHLPVGTVSVAIFTLSELLGLFDGHGAEFTGG